MLIGKNSVGRSSTPTEMPFPSGFFASDGIFRAGRVSDSKVFFGKRRTQTAVWGVIVIALIPIPRGIPSTLVDGILQVSGVPAHAYWERRGQLLVGF